MPLVTVMKFHLQNKADSKKGKKMLITSINFFFITLSFYKVDEIVFKNTHHENRKNVKYHTKKYRPQKMYTISYRNWPLYHYSI